MDCPGNLSGATQQADGNGKVNGRTNRRLPPFSSELHQADTVPIGYGKHNDKDPYDEHTDRQSGHDVAEQDPFSDENVEEVNGFIREDVLV